MLHSARQVLAGRGKVLKCLRSLIGSRYWTHTCTHARTHATTHAHTPSLSHTLSNVWGFLPNRSSVSCLLSAESSEGEIFIVGAFESSRFCSCISTQPLWLKRVTVVRCYPGPAPPNLQIRSKFSFFFFFYLRCICPFLWSIIMHNKTLKVRNSIISNCARWACAMDQRFLLNCTTVEF